MAGIRKTSIKKVDLNGGFAVDAEYKILGLNDTLADRIGVELTNNGSPINIGGASVVGLFIRADGNTVTVPGTATGNMAYIDLPQACYVVPGPYALSIKVTSAGVTGTLRLLCGEVKRTTSGAAIDPGSVVPTIEELLALLEQVRIDDTQASADHPWSGEKIRNELNVLFSENENYNPVDARTGEFVISDYQTNLAQGMPGAKSYYFAIEHGHRYRFTSLREYTSVPRIGLNDIGWRVGGVPIYERNQELTRIDDMSTDYAVWEWENVSDYAYALLYGTTTQNDAWQIDEIVGSKSGIIADLQNEVESMKKIKIACFGDSLTFGAGATDYRGYPSILADMIGDKYIVENYGVGGESADTIGARMGALIGLLESDKTFTQNTAIAFSARDVYGAELQPAKQYNRITMQNEIYGYVNGVRGIIAWNGSANTFKAESTVSVKAGTPIFMSQFDNDADIVLVCAGTNGVAGGSAPSTEQTANTWCQIGKLMQSFCRGKFLWIGLPTTAFDFSAQSTVDDAAVRAFGGGYLKSRFMLSKYGLILNGIEPTSADTQAMAETKIPPSLLYDTVHLNDHGYNAFATIIFNHLHGLGWI